MLPDPGGKKFWKRSPLPSGCRFWMKVALGDGCVGGPVGVRVANSPPTDAVTGGGVTVGGDGCTVVEGTVTGLLNVFRGEGWPNELNALLAGDCLGVPNCEPNESNGLLKDLNCVLGGAGDALLLNILRTLGKRSNLWERNITNH